MEIWLRYRLDGTYFCCAGRERKITSDQATRVLSLIWSGEWQTEAIHILRRGTNDVVSKINL